MCGIAGCYPLQQFNQVAESLVTIAHRGPDAKGLFETPHGTFGQVRLAILDVAGGYQPMSDESSLIVFNGEIYNYKSLQRQFAGSIHTDSDTEVILKLYRSCGTQCVDFLDGMFAFAALDQGDLFLARDPLGIKPLYYSVNDGTVWFASEIKALLGKASNVQEFPPGHWWHSRHGLKRYYDLDKVRGRNGEKAEPNDKILVQLQNVLRKAVHKRLIADESIPVGVSQSGGLDSSLVAALARETKDPLDTFVVGTAGSEDVEASRQVAKFLGTRHHVYVYDFDEMLQSLPEIIYHLESYDAPLVRSAIPNYFLARLAADHVKVILLGEGADELFAGYEYLAALQDPQALDEELRLITGSLHNTNLQRADRMTMAHSIEGRVPFLDKEVIQTVFAFPAEWKLSGQNRCEKELLRQSAANLLPENIVWRKQKFSEGAGSMNALTEYANQKISEEEFVRNRTSPEGPRIRSREELLYYYTFKEVFGDSISPDMVGITHSVTRNELN
jgi:asparagine synthase (glutamine-hydrolysing)